MTTKHGLKVEKITPLCQLQDLGRIGYQRYGVARSGAMDPYALRLANILAGNPQGEACLEFALAGAAFEVTAVRLHFAFVGSFPVVINDELFPPNASYTLERGERLEIGATDGSEGTHGYLAVLGGFAAQPELGSGATHLRSGIGGFADVLKPGVILPTKHDEAPLAIERQLPDSLLRTPAKTIRVVPGPQSDYFSPEKTRAFFETRWRIAANSDRMGYRLDGGTIDALDSKAGDAGHMISEAVSPGSVQIPAGGAPIVLMADCGTVGGYPKIATVISVDRGRLAQLRVGSEFAFEEVSVDTAQQLLREEVSSFGRYQDEIGDN